MKLLALDTSTEACSAAVWVDGDVVERFEAKAQHSARILDMVQQVLSETGLTLRQLDCLAFGRGPGSFTGLRIGTGVVQGLAFGAGLPVAAVSSLAALAQGTEGENLLPAFDARMNQIYWGVYRRNGAGMVEEAGQERVGDPAHVPLPAGAGWTGAGSGWDRYGDVLSSRLGARLQGWREGLFPRAQHVAELGAACFRAGKTVDPELAIPVYLRDDVAHPQRQG